MIRSASPAMLFGMLLVAGCQSTTAVPTAASSASPGDLQFATNAAQIIKFDQQECTLAQVHATNPEVRTLAAKLLDEANAFQARLVPAAAEAGIKLPDTLDDMRRVRIGHMNLQNGLDFDRSFISDQIASHQDALYMEQAVPTEGNSSLDHLARQGQALIATNLRELQDLQRRL